MAHDPRARSGAQQRSRADGVTIAPAPGSRKLALWLAAAAAVAAFTLLLWAGPPPQREAPRASDAPAARDERASATVELASAPRAKAHPVRVRTGPPASPPETPPSVPPKPETPEDEGTRLLASTPSGIGLYPPPGTDPPKIGIVVPEGFELPEGYVRHYQVTDDGQPLPPILMFHPDYDWVDETGAHVEVSGNGVVPPELAPEGMPIRMLELPEPPSQP